MNGSFRSRSKVVVRLTSNRDDSVVCCHSAMLLRSSCGECCTETILLSAVILSYHYGRRGECCTETILLSAVILSYHYGRHVANVAQRRSCCLLSFCHITTVVMWRMLHRDDLVVCRRSDIRLWPSGHAHSAERILLSAVVLTYGSGCQAVHIVQRGFCCQPLFWHTALPVRPCT